MQFYGFVPRMLLGVLFGYLLVWSGSLWLPVIAHLLNNGIAVIAVFLINNDLLSPKLENIGSTSDSYYWAAIGLILTIFLLWFFKRENQGNNLPVPIED